MYSLFSEQASLARTRIEKRRPAPFQVVAIFHLQTRRRLMWGLIKVGSERLI